MAEMNTIFIIMLLICAESPKTKNCCVFVNWEWALLTDSLTESVNKFHHVSTVAQYGQIEGLGEMSVVK